MYKIQVQYYKSPYGELMLGTFQDKLCLCDWRYRKLRSGIDNRIQQNLHAGFETKANDLIEKSIVQLEEYFQKRREIFTIPLLFAGSDFQQKVWEELLEIPFGKTITYLELSRRVGDEKAIRAVASANGANAMSIFVPCHRVIGSNGELTGYAGGIDSKRKLLELEGALCKNEQLRLF